MIADPLSAADFAALMAPLAPFEPAPRVAVAVSGGADSMALALLAAEWALGQGGEVLALTVDHGLRPGSDAEAARVGAWLAARGIPHRVLAWRGAKPQADIQAAARAARYGLLEAACREAGILHLLLAHHRDDQAETFLLRLGRGSGLDGLAAMPAIHETAWTRLLRPLLAVPRARLAATCRAAGQAWVEDPSNDDPRHSRVRLRRLMPALAGEGLSAARLAATSRHLGRGRAAQEEWLADCVLRHVTIAPAGYAEARSEIFRSLPEELAARLLSRLVMAVGGQEYAPRFDRLEGMLAALRAGLAGARTLGGCRIGPVAGGILVSREVARMAPPVPLEPGGEAWWDGRFRLRVRPGAPAGLRLGALGQSGWSRLAALAGRPLPPVPAPARATLPTLYREEAIFAVPHLGYNRDVDAERTLEWIVAAPPNPLTVAGRCLV